MKEKILYVEDDAINAFVILKFLEKDFEITHVPDGESCLIRISEYPYRLVLMDINLGKGKMDGTETMHKIKLLPAYKNTPVIAVTSYALPEDKERFLGEGFDDYLSKPVDRKLLLERVRRFLD